MNIAINGLGRIGRPALKQLVNSEHKIVAVNDLADIENLVYLLKYDSVYGRFEKEVSVEGDSLKVGGVKILKLQESDPAKLPWKELGIDVVLECTGVFNTKELASKHLEAGARQVIISAPVKDKETPTYVIGVNTDKDIKGKIISSASCTTNCLAPAMEVLNRNFEVKKSIMTTIHSYTSSQSLVDSVHKKWARGRAAALNLIPTTTGAALATKKVLPEIGDSFDGLAIRVPSAVGSLADITAIIGKQTTVEEINKVFEKESKSDRYKGILNYTNQPLVSSDFIGDEHSATIAGEFTRVVAGDMVKILAWYDNELAYTKRLVELLGKLKS